MNFVSDEQLKQAVKELAGAKPSYHDKLAQKRGFVDYAEYMQYLRFKKGIGTGLSISESKNSPQYLGIYIAERLLPDIFQDPIIMTYGNRGYDAICKNNYKVDVKCSIYLFSNNRWIFTINYNKIADVFLCIAFDNRIDLNVQHIWLIPGDAIIRNRRLSGFKVLTISNSSYSLSQFLKYELVDKKDKANLVCVMFKNGVLK